MVDTTIKKFTIITSVCAIIILIIRCVRCETGKKQPVPRHNEIDENLAKHIMKELT